MKKVSIRETKTYLCRMLEQVSTGKLSLRQAKLDLATFLDSVGQEEEIIITRNGEAIALIVPFGN